VAIAILMVGAYWMLKEELTLDRLVSHQQALRDALNKSPVIVIGIAFFVYVLVTALLVGSATAVSVLYGWLFGLFMGIVLVSFASTSGATLTFLASRYLFRQSVERRFGQTARRVDNAFARSGAWYLLSLRLIPGIPFFLLNAVMGLTPIRVRTYWWVSQLGMLPATAIFVYAGSTVPNLATIQERGLSSILSWKLGLALLLLGLFPLLVGWLRRRRNFQTNDRPAGTAA
jgi:uncharacterized membrane protein YdjX (TVP38/TMEM64 family)